MTDRNRSAELLRGLASFGSDFSRWPPERAVGAREALLGDPDFRRAWEAERQLDRALAGHRDELDQAIEQSGAAERMRRRTLGQLPVVAFADMHWQRIAAAVLVAGMLGGAMDVFLPEEAAQNPDVVVLDPFFSLDDPELQ